MIYRKLDIFLILLQFAGLDIFLFFEYLVILSFVEGDPGGFLAWYSLWSQVCCELAFLFCFVFSCPFFYPLVSKSKERD